MSPSTPANTVIRASLAARAGAGSASEPVIAGLRAHHAELVGRLQAGPEVWRVAITRVD